MVLIISISICYGGATDKTKDLYIVYMGSLPESDYSPLSHHLSLLQEVLGESSASDSFVRSYNRSFNAFAARLSGEEHKKIASKEGVVSVFPSRTLQLQTTRSWEFMGFPENVDRNLTIESDIIIGVIDSGIWPESDSFSDEGYGPPPKKWKGTCDGGLNFTCNNKIIGARFYTLDIHSNSARDEEGHGSHTASIAAGNKVAGANFYGLANGNARGGVPSARIATYRICGRGGCTDDSILGAFDDAIADGVDIITISVSGSPRPFNFDSIAIGSFHAMEKGILTVQSAGNDGPFPSTVGSVAPWLFSVAASSTDRRIIDKVVLGNGKTLIGNAVNSFTLKGVKFPLIKGEDAKSNCSDADARLCSDHCLDSSLVKEKIVVCDKSTGWNEAFRAGALGSITLDEDYFVVPLPSSGLTSHNHDLVKSYINSTSNPHGEIIRSEAIKDIAAPKFAFFSSRGPNSISDEILKPDITAPGVYILAAYSPVASPSSAPGDKRSVKYNILSGTSMSCPHVVGAAAYVKSFHPHWSPSAIKSALMTTALSINVTEHSDGKYEDGEFAYGAGHVNPVKAIDPGLLYEASKDDYMKMLYSMQVRLFSPSPKETKGSQDLNYPSMQALVKIGKPFTVEFTRTVTNVGLPNSTYKSKLIANSQINVSVKPSSISFKLLYEKKSFIVKVSGEALTAKTRISASLIWSDGTHNVKSPIVMYTKRIQKNEG
ncbi:subtilisin-like protease SBT4.3 isoform X2 [Castanea sativa]|uniref:subtilisin-like protease SBT4.3 isoform X2 n=1 Tax=Castanea sativa TaxID=21020 RepID=UPI003F64DF45